LYVLKFRVTETSQTRTSAELDVNTDQ